MQFLKEIVHNGKSSVMAGVKEASWELLVCRLGHVGAPVCRWGGQMEPLGKAGP